MDKQTSINKSHISIDAEKYFVRARSVYLNVLQFVWRLRMTCGATLKVYHPFLICPKYRK